MPSSVVYLKLGNETLMRTQNCLLPSKSYRTYFESHMLGAMNHKYDGKTLFFWLVPRVQQAAT